MAFPTGYSTDQEVNGEVYRATAPLRACGRYLRVKHKSSQAFPHYIPGCSPSLASSPFPTHQFCYNGDYRECY